MEEEKEQEGHLLFTDGSSLGNPGPGGWATILVLSGGRVMEMGGREAHTTNNRMELMALAKGLERIADESGCVTIYTDSKYVHKGATEWSAGWKKRGWVTMAKTPVGNRELWEETLALIDDRKKWGKMFWKHVPGHSGVVGNERCDEIATTYAKGDTPELFEGDLGDYAIDILNITIDEEKSAERSVARAHGRTKAYSYLSLVGGVAKRHATWPLCEARVKGKPGVKYKKSVSQEDEAAILRSWGASL
jgi:ribonuclease HI